MKAIARFRDSLEKRGAAGTMRVVVGKLAAQILRRFRALREFAFDLRRGVDTRGIGEQPAGPGLGDAHRYEVTPPRVLRRTLRSLPLVPADFTFVDVGCGKGAALLVAAEFPFARIVGVEADANLARVAEANLAHTGRRGEILNADALEFAIPPGPVVLYLYNPFAASVLEAFLANVEASLAADPRRLWIVYFQPDFHVLLDDAPFLALTRRAKRMRVYVAAN